MWGEVAAWEGSTTVWAGRCAGAPRREVSEASDLNAKNTRGLTLIHWFSLVHFRSCHASATCRMKRDPKIAAKIIQGFRSQVTVV